MAILKANGKILRANHKILVKNAPNYQFLFVNYFDNYIFQNGIYVCKSVVGPDSTPLSAFPTKMNTQTPIGYYQLPSLNYLNNITIYDIQFSDKASFEFFAYVDNFGAYADMGFSSILGLRYKIEYDQILNCYEGPLLQFSGNNVNIVNFTFLENRIFTDYFSTNRKAIPLKPNVRGWHFFSCVYDKFECRIYIDGILSVTFTALNANYLNFSFSVWDSGQTSYWTRATQFAVIDGDKSTNQGTQYIVPTTPYF